ncbi:MAG: hypothetical protein WBG70_15745 [Spirulinaceae cyanobacterium]
MSNFKYGRFGISLLVVCGAIATATTPLLTAIPASAQLFPAQENNNVTPQPIVMPAATTLPVEYKEAEKIILTKEETVPLTLTVAANIKNKQGEVLIPYGSEIIGELQPKDGGSQFVAQELVISTEKRQPLQATSQVITRTEKINEGTDTGDILQGAAIGGAAAAIIALITGDNSIDLLEVLGGAGLGALGGILLGGKETEVISINPNEDLNVTLLEDLSLEN